MILTPYGDESININDISDLDYVRELLLGSLMTFTRFFYKEKNGRDFIISEPVGRESHYITVWRMLKQIFLLQVNRCVINIPPGFGKSTMCAYFVAWCYANYPDCNFIYISYAYQLAEKHTAIIKEIMELPIYKKLFGVELRSDSKAKGSFKTQVGGMCGAYGSAGAITGMDGGLPNQDRFSGGVLIDDSHKPDECHSNTLRKKVFTNYDETIMQRPRGPNVPILFIGQRLHEDDLPKHLLDGKDGYYWDRIILKNLDEAGNALAPNIITKERLLIVKERSPYVFASQHQQEPQPAGGGIFQGEWFTVPDQEPKIISSFITVDTAETDKSWNDATVFSFFGIYRIMHKDVDSGIYGLHWLDCKEMRVEPKDLESEFYSFYSSCMRYEVKPDIAIIEKKSTGVTLCSVLKNMPGLRIMELDRNVASGCKTTRFLNCQQYIAAKRVTFPENGRHNDMCITHCKKITANNTHAHDDIMDTLQTAIEIALIDKTILPKEPDKTDQIFEAFNSHLNHIKNLRRQR